MWIDLIIYIILVQLCVAGEKSQPSSGHMREKRPIISFRRHEDVSYCIKSGRMSGLLVSGVKVVEVRTVRRHWWHSRSHIPHEPSDVRVACTWVCRQLDGSTCSECLPEGTCDFGPLEHVGRTSAMAQTCVWGPGGRPACHGAQITRKDPRPDEQKNSEGPKIRISMYS